MENKRIRDIEGYEAFKAECSFFKCEEEYPGWVGKEKYGIITGLSKAELETKYPQFIKAMSPYVLLDLEYGEIRAEAKRNDDKFEKRGINNNSIFELDEEAARINSELSVPDFLTEIIEKQDEEARNHELEMLCGEMLSHFTVKQQDRLVKRYVLEKTLQQIADEEGCSVSSIHESLTRSKNKFQEIFEKTRKNWASNSMHYEGISSILNRLISSNNEN